LGAHFSPSHSKIAFRFFAKLGSEFTQVAQELSDQKTQCALLRLSSRIALWIAVGTHSLWMEPTNGYANIFGPISPLISMILSAGTLFLRAAARIASGLGAS
jgi:hypothetical protein